MNWNISFCKNTNLVGLEECNIDENLMFATKLQPGFETWNVNHVVIVKL